ncbi:MAG: hypothetical protein KAJ19_29745 [Gammaproteobacteria bacterium]|nr:hypothetical protein [Gammaproteobacteria bacterium]
MSQFRIIDVNEALNAALSVSSEKTEFPKENVQHPHRTRVWRTDNYFNITSSNNKIDFDEGGGELTATLTTGVYTGPDDLRTEIIVQLEATGADQYSCTFSPTTGIWAIGNNDGPTFSLLWNTGTNSANSVGPTIGFSAAADDTGSLGYAADAPAIHTEEWIEFDFSAARNIDSFVLVFDPVDGSTLSSSAVVTLQANSSSSWGAPPVSQVVAFDSVYNVFSHFFTAAENYRYWRILIEDPTNPDHVNIDLGVVVLGEATQLTQGPQIGMADTLMDQSQVSKTRYGHRYFDEYPIARSESFTYTALSKADLETLQSVFKAVGNHTPVTIALDPLATLFDKDRFLMYSFFDGEIEAKNTFYEFFDTEISFMEAF